MSEQKHPLAHIDREIVKRILVEGKNDYNLAEVARLKIRYHNFPGARDIQLDLETIMERWQLSEAELFAETRSLHSLGRVYRTKSEREEDWS